MKRSIPEIRIRLLELSEEMAVLASELKRRPAIRKAKATSTKMGLWLRVEIRAYAHQHPEASLQSIAAVFNVNPGRVSEALRKL